MADKKIDSKKIIKEFEEKLLKLIKEYNIEMTPGIDFPIYKEIPIEAQLAVQIINNYKGVFVLNYKLKDTALVREEKTV
jgi:hypothetical protein